MRELPLDRTDKLRRLRRGGDQTQDRPSRPLFQLPRESERQLHHVPHARRPQQTTARDIHRPLHSRARFVKDDLAVMTFARPMELVPASFLFGDDTNVVIGQFHVQSVESDERHMTGRAVL
jgi:hypothetical protein